MNIEAKDVNEYLEKLPEGRRKAVGKIRRLAKKTYHKN